MQNNLFPENGYTNASTIESVIDCGNVYESIFRAFC
jgi:hypothetical protein